MNFLKSTNNLASSLFHLNAWHHHDSKIHGSHLELKKPDLHNQLLEYVKSSDVKAIRQLIKEHNELLTVKYAHPYYKSILPTARFNLLHQAYWSSIETLVDVGFEIFCEKNNHEELLFFAAANGKKDKLLETIKYFKNINPAVLNNTREGDTALMFLIKYGKAVGVNFVECARILIEVANIDVNIPDYNNCTPILRVAFLYQTGVRRTRNEYTDIFLENVRKVITVILDTGCVDIDSHKWHERTARQFITQHNLYDVVHYKRFSYKKRDIKSNLFTCVIAKDEQFFVSIKGVKDYNVSDGENTLLQLACILKLEKIVKHLLKRGADPNIITKRNHDTPLETAAKRNHHSIFEILLNAKSTKITQDTYAKFAEKKGNKLKIKYFSALLRHKKLDVDFVCKQGNTPLHYAAMHSESEAILNLLKQGASLVAKNNRNERPIDYIDPRLLTEHVNDCIEAKTKQNIYHKKSAISFNYKFLLKSETRINDMCSDCIRVEEDDNLLGSSKNNSFKSETEVVMDISENLELRSLLKHPVISSFLYVKWYKIKSYFWFIMAFHAWCYSWFLNYFLNCYIYGNIELGWVFWVFLATYLLYIAFMVVRVVVIRKELNMHVHIYIECLLLVIIFAVICWPDMDVRKHTAVLGIILGAFSLIFWAGYHPKMSMSVAMLQRVSYNFFRILLCYCILIVAFGICFYVLFNKRYKRANKSNYAINDSAVVNDQIGSPIEEKNEEEEEESEFFKYPTTSIFKAFVMMTGEFETSEMQFEKSSYSSYIVFLLFVFMISLILMNVLTGVAITDTESVQNDTEIIGHISTIRFIRFIESILQPIFVPKLIYKAGGKIEDCFLMPDDLKNYKLLIYPNQLGKVKCESHSKLKQMRLNKKIVKEAMSIIIRKENRRWTKLENDYKEIQKEIKLAKEEIRKLNEFQRAGEQQMHKSVEDINKQLKILVNKLCKSE